MKLNHLHSRYLRTGIKCLLSEQADVTDEAAFQGMRSPLTMWAARYQKQLSQAMQTFIESDHISSGLVITKKAMLLRLGFYPEGYPKSL